jgi:hypothetical protein
MPWRGVGEWRYSCTILDLSTRWRGVVSFTSRPLYLWGKSPWYSLDGRLGGPQTQCQRCEVEKNLLPLPGIKPWPSSPLLYSLSYSKIFVQISNSNKNSRHVNVYFQFILWCGLLHYVPRLIAGYWCFGGTCCLHL